MSSVAPFTISGRAVSLLAAWLSPTAVDTQATIKSTMQTLGDQMLATMTSVRPSNRFPGWRVPVPLAGLVRGIRRVPLIYLAERTKEIVSPIFYTWGNAGLIRFSEAAKLNAGDNVARGRGSTPTTKPIYARPSAGGADRKVARLSRDSVYTHQRGL